MRKIFFSLFMMIIAVCSTVSAFGVSSNYWEENPLYMSGGETLIVDLNIQNMEDKDITVSAVLTEGDDIASISEEAIEIKAKTSNTTIPLEITLPSGISSGEVKKIKVEFNTINAEGGIAVQSGVSASFSVIATEQAPQEKNTQLVMGIIIGILLLSLILWFILKNNKRGK